MTNRTGVAYPCGRCWALVRSVETEDGRIIILDAEPHPKGEWIPWPSRNPTGLAQARRVPDGVSDERRWRKHSCLYTRGREYR